MNTPLSLSLCVYIYIYIYIYSSSQSYCDSYKILFNVSINFIIILSYVFFLPAFITIPGTKTTTSFFLDFVFCVVQYSGCWLLAGG